MRTAPRRASAIAATLLSVAVATTACSGDSSGDPTGPEGAAADGGSTATDPDAAPPLATKATLGRVTGRLPKAKQSKVRKQVARAVDAGSTRRTSPATIRATTSRTPGPASPRAPRPTPKATNS